MLTVGVLAKGGRDWIGGAVYTAGLVRALRSLPRHRQPRVVVLIPRDTDAAQAAELASLGAVERLPPAADWSDDVPSNDPLARLLERLGVSLVFPCMRSMMPAFPVAWLPWVPDLQHLYMPEYFDEAERAERDQRYWRIAEDAALVVVSSNHAGRGMAATYPACRDKLRVLSFAGGPQPGWFTADPQAAARRLGLPSRYLLVANQFWAHKNHATAFEAVRLLAAQGVDVHLVCTGRTDDPRRPEYMEQLRASLADGPLAGRVHLTGLLPRDEQIQLMRGAVAVVQPSLFEGWSTVVEDARMLGKPVLLSDIPVHREQAPPQGVYFAPLDAEGLAGAIRRCWCEINPAFDEQAESAALQAQSQRVGDFAGRFLDIAGECLAPMVVPA